jgi:hypothetical protein
MLMLQGKSNIPPTDKQRSLARLVFAAFLVFGVVLTIIATFWLWARIDYVRHSVNVQATIIDLEARKSSKGPPTYAPTFRFETAEGVIRVIKSQASYADGVFEDRTVRVVYNPINEEGLLLDRFRTLYGPPLFLSSFGLVWSIASILAFRNASKKPPLNSEFVIS